MQNSSKIVQGFCGFPGPALAKGSEFYGLGCPVMCFHDGAASGDCSRSNVEELIGD